MLNYLAQESFAQTQVQDLTAGVFTDYTQRANGTIAVADTGQTITTWGGTPPTIVSGQLVCANFQTSPTAGYATHDCGSAPYEYRSRFVLQPQSAGSNSTVGNAAHLVSQTLMTSTGQIATTDFLHVLILADGFKLQFHDGGGNTYTDFHTDETANGSGYELFTRRLPDDGVSVNEVCVRYTSEGGGKLYVELPDGTYREYGGSANATQAAFITRAWGRYVTQEPFGTTVGDSEARFLSFEAYVTTALTSPNKFYASPIKISRDRTRSGQKSSKKLIFTPSATLAFTGGPTGGTFTMSVTARGTTQTATANYSTTAATLDSNLQTALQALSNVGAGKATVTGAVNGGPYTVTFDPSLDGVSITVSGAGLTGGSSPAASCSFNTGWYRVALVAAGNFQVSGLLRVSSNPLYAKSFYATSRAASDLLWFTYTLSGLGCELNQLGHASRGDNVVSQVRMSDDGQNTGIYLDLNVTGVGSSTVTPITVELDYGTGVRLLPNPIPGVSAGANQVTTITLNSGLTTTGNVTAAVAGSGVRIKEGSNARMGTGTLSGGTVTIANTSVTASTRVFLTRTGSGTSTGQLRVSAQTASTSFVVTSTDNTDAGTFNYLLVEPAP